MGCSYENPVPKRRSDHHIPVIPAYSTELHSNLLRQFERGPVSTGAQLSLRRVVTDYFVVCRETLTVHTLKTRGNGCPTHLKTDMAGMRRETDWWVGKWARVFLRCWMSDPRIQLKSTCQHFNSTWNVILFKKKVASPYASKKNISNTNHYQFLNNPISFH